MQKEIKIQSFERWKTKQIDTIRIRAYYRGMRAGIALSLIAFGIAIIIGLVTN